MPPDFDTFCASVDEIVPMFYDLERDSPAAVAAGEPLLMIDESTLRWILKWQACPIPWRAGLANFQRLTQFSPEGQLIGHHRSWSTAGLLTHPAIERRSSPDPSISHFEVTAGGSMSRIPIRAGEKLFIRMPDEALTREAIQAAHDAGALGIVWFAHPRSAPRTWHSVEHLAAMQAGKAAPAKLDLEITPDGAILLTNPGPTDLQAQPGHHPWRLVISGPPGSFGRGLPGGFLECDLEGASMNHPELATRLILTFPSLLTNDRLVSSTGLITQPESITWTLEPQP